MPQQRRLFEAATTPGLWRHKWRPIQFCLLVDDFGIKYVGEKHALHLKAALLQHYEISEDWEGKKFVGIDLEWNYAANHKDCTCRLSIKNYIRDLLIRVGHPMPSKNKYHPTSTAKLYMVPNNSIRMSRV